MVRLAGEIREWKSWLDNIQGRLNMLCEAYLLDLHYLLSGVKFCHPNQPFLKIGAGREMPMILVQRCPIYCLPSFVLITEPQSYIGRLKLIHGVLARK